MKDTGKRFVDPKPNTSYPFTKPKALAYTGKSDRYASNTLEPKSMLHGQPSTSIYREPPHRISDFSGRAEDTGPDDETRAYIWALALKNEKLISKLITEDREIEETPLTLVNQRVVKNDCLRTRVGLFDDEMRDKLEKIMTCYCMSEQITYKQGLNEVAAPFVNFAKSHVNISNIYNYLVLFIDKFLPTSFIDKDFLSLQCYFRTLELLIKYHDPNFHTFLTRNDLPSELYATPWFLTLFASKMSLEMVYLLWDIYIYENDTCFKFFIGLALLLENKMLIIGSETSMIPQTISNLTIQNMDQMKQIYKKAVDLRMRTPSSFLGKLRELDILKKDYLTDSEFKSRMEKNVEYLESLQCVLVSSHELINALYHTEITCSNPDCLNYRIPVEEDNSSSRDIRTRAVSLDVSKRDKKSRKPSQKDSPYFEPGMGHRNSRKSKDIKAQCILCQSDNTTDGMSATMSTMPHLKDLIRYKETAKADKGEGPVVDFLIVDLRQNKSGGLLPKSHQVEFNKPMEETVNFLINDFIELQSQIHFVFMTSNFNSWMFKEALEARNLKNKKGPRGSLKSDRTGIKGPTMSIEDEWLIAFLDAFIQNGFPYLSILEGGFNEINKNLHLLNLETINHNPEYCPACRAEGAAKGQSFFTFFNKVIDKTGEKLGMFVEGINSNDVSRSRGRNTNLDKTDTSMSRTSQGFFNVKKEEEAKPSAAIRDRDKPRSLTTGLTPSNNMVSDSTQETGEYFAASSVYNSEPGGVQGFGSMTSLTSYLQGNYNTSEDHPFKLSSPVLEPSDSSYSGRTTAPGKIASSSSSSYKPSQQQQQQITNLPKPTQAPSQTSFSKSGSGFYTNQSMAEPPKMGFAASIGAYISPKAGNMEQNYSQIQGSYGYNPQLSTSYKADTLNASRYVFEAQKKKAEDSERRSENSEDLKYQKAGGSSVDKKGPATLHPYKAKSGDKTATAAAVGYSTYTGSSLAKVFKPPKQGEEDQKNRFYSTEFNVSKPFDRDNKGIVKEKTYKETSLIDSFHHIDSQGDNRNRLDQGYNSNTPKAFLESYTRQIHPIAGSNSKKGTITQFLKDTPTALTQPAESGNDGNMGYQSLLKPPLMTYANTATDIPHRIRDDTGRKISVTPDNNFYLESYGGDLPSTREIGSPRTMTQSPSPEKMLMLEGKMTNRGELVQKKKDMTIDTTMVYSNYTEMTSPLQADLLRGALSRVEEGKVTSRAQSIEENNYYEMNGIFREFKLSQNGVFWLYKTFEGVDFTFYSCFYLKDGLKDESSLSTVSSVSDYSSKRIVIISKDFLVAVQHSPEIVEDLRLLQVGLSVERILKRGRDNNKVQSAQSTFDRSLLSPKEYLGDRNSFASRDKSSGLDSYGGRRYDITVKALFPVKLLLRITSKKIDAKLLSFYFKLPTVDKMMAMNAAKYFSFSENNIQELHTLMKKEEYLRVLREVSDVKDPAVLLQSKSVCCFESPLEAQECIQKTKEAYSGASSYINEKLKKTTRI